MLDEDVVLKAPRYENERMLMIYIPAILLLPTLFGGDGMMAFAIMISLGILAPINIFTYPHNWIDADECCRRKFLLAVLPFAALFALTVFRIGYPMLEYVGNGSYGGYILNETSKTNVFASISSDNGTAVTEILTALSLFAAAVSVFFITQSRFIVRNILAACAAGICIIAMFGFLSEFLFSISAPSLRGIYGDFSFATLADANSWSFLAIIWSAAMMGATIYTFQRFKPVKFIFSVRGASIAISMVLAASAIYTATPLQKIFIYLQLTVFFIVFAVNVLPTQNMLKRHQNAELTKIKRRSKFQTFIPISVYSAAAVFFAFKAFGAYSGYSEIQNTPEVSKENAYHQTILNDTRELIAERPVLGWGMNSFSNALAFNQGDDIEFEPIENPDSDILKFLTENGYAGLILVILTPLFFGIRFILEFRISQSGIIFLTAIASVSIMSFFSTPFQSFTVFYSFFILMFAFFTWEDAEII